MSRGRLRRRLPVGLAAAAVALLCASGPAAARGGGFLAGAGRAETTPPLAGTQAGQAADSRFAPAFATCSAVFAGQGLFALQEPFTDPGGGSSWQPGDPFCDANADAHWDGIYADNGWGPATGVHDPLDARAVAISDGRHLPVVYVSVDAIGLFDAYTQQARHDLRHTYGVRAQMVVAADHNERSPDTIGLYGALQTPLGVGVRSGIDEFYMDFLADRIALAAARAVNALRPASLYANQVEGALPAGQSGNTYPLLSGLTQRISDQFPTSVALPGDDRVAAVDPKLGVLQARDRRGRPIFTVISLAAHNQEMGNAGAGLSADWPGAMERAFDAAHPGLAIFLAGDNGSEEDPQTDPTVVPNGSENHTNQAVQYEQAQATGQRFAQIASRAAADGVRLSPGAVRLVRRQICVPLENDGFLALAAAGDFGRRQAWVCNPQTNTPIHPLPNGSVLPTAGTEFRTFISYADLGPDFQFIDNPAESFPALMLGSPFGVEDESCPRPNPAVPTWHAGALFRFQVGLADDLIGYLIPPWGFASGIPGLFNNDACYQDQAGHRHKLESESVGPTGAADVANGLVSLLDAQPDPSARVVTGRYVLADGSLSRWPTGAVAVELAGGRVIGGATTSSFGSRAVGARGVFMDYDGQPQAGPDLTTRGIMLLGGDGCVAARYYLDVFPDVALPAPGGSAVSAPPRLPASPCRTLERAGVPELQPGAARVAGLAGPGVISPGLRPR